MILQGWESSKRNQCLKASRSADKQPLTSQYRQGGQGKFGRGWEGVGGHWEENERAWEGQGGQEQKDHGQEGDAGHNPAGARWALCLMHAYLQ